MTVSQQPQRSPPQSSTTRDALYTGPNDYDCDSDGSYCTNTDLPDVVRRLAVLQESVKNEVGDCVVPLAMTSVDVFTRGENKRCERAERAIHESLRQLQVLRGTDLTRAALVTWKKQATFEAICELARCTDGPIPIVELIDATIKGAKALVKSVTVYKGIRHNAFAIVRRGDRQFVTSRKIERLPLSTTNIFDVALQFANRGGLVIVLNLQPGQVVLKVDAKVKAISRSINHGSRDENEYVLPSGGTIEILNTRCFGDNVTVARCDWRSAYSQL